MPLDSTQDNSWGNLFRGAVTAAVSTGAEVIRAKYASPVGPQASPGDALPSITSPGQGSAPPPAAPIPLTKRAWFWPVLVVGGLLLGGGAFFFFRRNRRRK